MALTILFLKPNDGKISSVMQQAFEETNKNIPTNWIEESECMNVKERIKRNVYITQEFRGAAFKHLAATNNKVMGPMCILTSFEKEQRLPRMAHPVANLAMQGAVVCCTGLEQKIREELHQCVQWMCGTISKNFDTEVTHLVAGEVGSKKYLVAGSMKIPIMSPEWIHKLWHDSQHRNVSYEEAEYRALVCPLFQGFVVTVSGLSVNHRNDIKAIVEANGGQYSGDLAMSKNTHLITDQACGKKYEFAKKWNMSVVTPEWVHDSVKAGYCIDEVKYKVVPKEGEKKAAATTKTNTTSTPTKSTARAVRSSIAEPDVSMISMTHINETAMSSTSDTDITVDVNSTLTANATINNSNVTLTCEDSLNQIQVEQIKAGDFLGSCKIYLSGFSSSQESKLKQLINKAGGTRYSQLNAMVTHVVMSDARCEKDVNAIRDGDYSCVVVHGRWLLDCCVQGMMLDHSKYICTDEVFSDCDTTTIGTVTKVNAAVSRLTSSTEAGSQDSFTLMPPPGPSRRSNENKPMLSSVAGASAAGGGRRSSAGGMAVIRRSGASLKRSSSISSATEPAGGKRASLAGTGSGAVEPAEDEEDILSQYITSGTADTVDDAVLVQALEAGERQAAANQQTSSSNSSTNKSEDNSTKASLTAADKASTSKGDDTCEVAQTSDDACELFEGKTFVILSFPPDHAEQLVSIIQESKGKVLPLNTKSVPDYGVVPLFGGTVSIAVVDIVTNAWVQMCIENDCCLPLTANPLFTPLTMKDGAEPLSGCVMSISGYTGVERDVLMHVAETLGAICQEYFVRKPSKELQRSTHLLINAPEGSKYKAAKKWKLPAVSKRWLFACARTGQLMPTEDYLIENVDDDAMTQPAKEDSTFCESDISTAADNLSGVADAADHSTTASTGNKPGMTAVDHAQATTTADSSTTHKQQAVVDLDLENIDFDEETFNPHTISPLTGSNRSDKENDATTATTSSAMADNTSSSANATIASNRSSLSSANQQSMSSPRSSTSPSLDAPSTNTHHKGAKPGVLSEAASNFKTPVNVRLQELTSNARQRGGGGTSALGGVITTPGGSVDTPGIDTPGKFLSVGKEFLPRFDLRGVMAAVKTPDAEKDRRKSVPLDDILSMNMNKAVANSAIPHMSESPAPAHFSQTRHIREEPCGPLKGVIIVVSKKLSSQQSKYNNIVVSLGGQYRWTYDRSCTHYIFQGKANDLNKEFRQARDHNKIIVSPHWLYKCQEDNKYADCSQFPHTYNPNMVLSVVTKTESPAAGVEMSQTRRSNRIKRTQAAATTSSATTVRQEGAGDIGSDGASSAHEDQTSAAAPPARSLRGRKLRDAAKETNEASTTAEPSTNEDKTSRLTDDYVNDLKNIMANSGSLRNKRLNSFNDSADSSKNLSRNNSRSRLADSLSTTNSPQDKIRNSNPDNLRTDQATCPAGTEFSEFSQQVDVVWEDPVDRKHQEIVEKDLAKHSESLSPRPYAHSSSLEYDQKAAENSSGTEDDKVAAAAKLNAKRADAAEDNPASSSRSSTSASTSGNRSGAGVSAVANTSTLVDAVDIPDDTPQDTLVLSETNGHIFLFSGMSPQDRDNFAAIVERLGGSVHNANYYDERCTHLIINQPTRNEKYLACVAAGKWVLHRSYIEQCDKHNAFVHESDYEWGGPGIQPVLSELPPLANKLAHAAHRLRKELHQKQLQGKKCSGTFAGWRVLVITERTREAGFRRLLIAGGASVVPCDLPDLSSLTHAFMDLSKYKGDHKPDLRRFINANVPCLKPEYIAAYLTDHPPPQHDNYVITEVQNLLDMNSQNSSESQKRKLSIPAVGIRKRQRHK